VQGTECNNTVLLRTRTSQSAQPTLTFSVFHSLCPFTVKSLGGNQSVGVLACTRTCTERVRVHDVNACHPVQPSQPKVVAHVRAVRSLMHCVEFSVYAHDGCVHCPIAAPSSVALGVTRYCPCDCYAATDSEYDDLSSKYEACLKNTGKMA
jgi:hypothetical protein